MAQRIVLYWRDIPAQVIVRRGRLSVKRALPPRFMEAVDRCAMRVGAHGSEAYLAEWRRGDPVECGDELEAEADRAVAEIVAAYDESRLEALILAGGRASSPT